MHREKEKCDHWESSKYLNWGMCKKALKKDNMIEWFEWYFIKIIELLFSNRKSAWWILCSARIYLYLLGRLPPIFSSLLDLSIFLDDPTFWNFRFWRWAHSQISQFSGSWYTRKWLQGTNWWAGPSSHLICGSKSFGWECGLWSDHFCFHIGVPEQDS